MVWVVAAFSPIAMNTSPEPPLRGGVRNQQAHGGLEARVVAELLDIEEEPVIVQRDGRRLIKKPCIDALLAGPGSELDRGQLCFIHYSLVFLLVAPLRQFVPQI